MKTALIIIAVVFVALVASYAVVSWCLRRMYRTPDRMNDIRVYDGVYRGFMPTDESATASGEVVIDLSYPSASLRMATGIRVSASDLPIEELIPMTAAEVKAQFMPGALAAAHTVGFRHKDNPSYCLLFPQHRGKDDPALIVRTGGMHDILGPTYLFDATQVAEGAFARHLRALEAPFKDHVVPRLEAGGRAPAHLR